MELQINPGHGVHISEALERHVRESLTRVEHRFGDRLTRIEVHFKDVNGPKGGIDKQCAMEARPAGAAAVGVSCQAQDAYDAIKGAAQKLEKAIEHRTARNGDTRSPR